MLPPPIITIDVVGNKMNKNVKAAAVVAAQRHELGATSNAAARRQWYT